MKPWRTIGTAPSGMTLRERDGEFVIYTGNQVLMSSRLHHSEEQMATEGCAGLLNPEPAVLVGGLGMGYTLRACLNMLGPSARVHVCEISPEVVEWNKGPLGALNGHPLTDARVEVEVGDVWDSLQHPGAFDAVLLDVDNGPAALSRTSNRSLYGEAGLQRLHRALKPSGRFVLWSAGNDSRFVQRVRQNSFELEVRAVRASASGGPTHQLFVGLRK